MRQGHAVPRHSSFVWLLSLATCPLLRRQVVAAVLEMLPVFWDVTPCRLVRSPMFRRSVPPCIHCILRNMHLLSSCVHLPISGQQDPMFSTPVTKTQELLHFISLQSLNVIPPPPSSLSKWTFYNRYPHKNSPDILVSPTKVNAQILTILNDVL
jgi:hypothetical protein